MGDLALAEPARCDEDRAAGDRPSVAPHGIQGVLALEIAKQGRASVCGPDADLRALACVSRVGPRPAATVVVRGDAPPDGRGSPEPQHRPNWRATITVPCLQAASEGQGKPEATRPIAR
jgi:hypothetical protein